MQSPPQAPTCKPSSTTSAPAPNQIFSLAPLFPFLYRTHTATATRKSQPPGVSRRHIREDSLFLSQRPLSIPLTLTCTSCSSHSSLFPFILQPNTGGYRVHVQVRTGKKGYKREKREYMHKFQKAWSRKLKPLSSSGFHCMYQASVIRLHFQAPIIMRQASV